jgi:4-hydroxybutyrate dehydrogenase
MKGLYKFTVPIPIVFDPTGFSYLKDVIRELGTPRPLIVTDKNIRQAGFVDTALELINIYGHESRVFDGVSSNPREEEVLRCFELFRKTEADSLIAIGGGSVIDAAKAVRVLDTHDPPLTDYDHRQPSGTRLYRDLPKLIAVPTTAGSGSEVSRGALITTRRGDVVRKTFIAHYRMVPTAAIVDPSLTIHCPPPIVRGCAMDTFTHLIEELSSPVFHPVASGVATHALRRVAESLPLVRDHWDKGNVRAELALGSLMAGMSFEKGLGVVHSLSHAIGAIVDAHHGLLNAAILPHALRFNRDHVASNTGILLAAAAGLKAKSDAHAMDALAAWVDDLVAKLEIPRRLRDLGVAPHREDEIVSRALEDHCHLTNPRPCGEKDMRDLFQAAW